MQRFRLLQLLIKGTNFTLEASLVSVHPTTVCFVFKENRVCFVWNATEAPLLSIRDGLWAWQFPFLSCLLCFFVTSFVNAALCLQGVLKIIFTSICWHHRRHFSLKPKLSWWAVFSEMSFEQGERAKPHLWAWVPESLVPSLKRTGRTPGSLSHHGQLTICGTHGMSFLVSDFALLSLKLAQMPPHWKKLTKAYPVN